MKKLRLDPETKAYIDNLVKNSPKVKVIEKDPHKEGQERFKTINLFLRGRECIARGLKVDLNGNPFKENDAYQFDDFPVYYDLKDLILKAFRKGGKDEVIKVYQEFLVNYEKAKKLATQD